ncbi:(Fe-S)-binding protein [Telmatospirillum sp. J64-1]|uniref:(Fe-S)-binding protein n=1 Tax=Telmatospirillum sp. J64-1 TaxID=2502183 RepID=UPI001C8F2C07|nr:(Fe-S)-binding protein [Telmatospirillum sp. J64-1]
MATTKPSTVYFFGTCIIDLVYPQAGLSAVNLLEREGIRVVFPQGQSCCGQPAYNCGYPDEARAVARHQVELFHQPWPVVVPSGSCAGMMAKHYPSLFKGDPFLPRVENFSSRVIELTQFLVNVLDLKLEDKGEPVKVTWHSSCHSMREMGVGDEPKELLRRLSNVELQELKRERECCGFGGTFSVRHPEISAAMAEDKVADIRATGAKTVLSGDCGCLMNIGTRMEADAKEARGEVIDGKHIAEFLWERTNG